MRHKLETRRMRAHQMLKECVFGKPSRRGSAVSVFKRPTFFSFSKIFVLRVAEKVTLLCGEETLEPRKYIHLERATGIFTSIL